MATFHLSPDEIRLVRLGLTASKEKLDSEAKKLESMGYLSEAGRLRTDAVSIGEDLLPKFEEQLPLTMGGSQQPSEK